MKQILLILLTLLLSGNAAEPGLPQEIAEPAPDSPPAAIVEEVAEERWLYIRGSEGKPHPDGYTAPAPDPYAADKQDEYDYIHQRLTFTVVDSSGQPVPGLTLTLCGNSEETAFLQNFTASARSDFAGEIHLPSPVPIAPIRGCIQGEPDPATGERPSQSWEWSTKELDQEATGHYTIIWTQGTAQEMLERHTIAIPIRIGNGTELARPEEVSFIAELPGAARLEQQTLFLPEKQAYLCQVLLPSGTSREDWAGATLQLHAWYLIEKSVERGTINLNGEGEVPLSDAPAEVVLTLQ